MPEQRAPAAWYVPRLGTWLAYNATQTRFQLPCARRQLAHARSSLPPVLSNFVEASHATPPLPTFYCSRFPPSPECPTFYRPGPCRAAGSHVLQVRVLPGPQGPVTTRQAAPCADGGARPSQYQGPLAKHVAAGPGCRLRKRPARKDYAHMESATQKCGPAKTKEFWLQHYVPLQLGSTRATPKPTSQGEHLPPLMPELHLLAYSCGGASKSA